MSRFPDLNQLDKDLRSDAEQAKGMKAERENPGQRSPKQVRNCSLDEPKIDNGLARSPDPPYVPRLRAEREVFRVLGVLQL
jgi:hypothetical protein